MATQNEERIETLLMLAWSSQNVNRILAIADQVLEINPDRVEALLLKADNIKDENKRAELLAHALKAINIPGNCGTDDRDLLLSAINERLAYIFFLAGKLDEAFNFCQNAIKFAKSDDDSDGNMKALFYRILIERRDWQRILSESMRDTEITLARAYAKLLAAWAMTPNNNKSVCASLFWDALMIAPDVPFYMVGFYEEPDDNASEEVHDEFNFALMYYDILSILDGFKDWFTRGVMLFGLLSGRFDDKEHDYILDALDSLGGYEDYEKMKNILVETEDRAVIEALAANKCLSN